MKVDLKKAGNFGKDNMKKIGSITGKLTGNLKDVATKSMSTFNTHKPKFIDEFKAFLDKYGVIGLAVAFVMGGATQKLVTATVQSLVMPIIAVVTPSGDWQTMMLNIWKFHFAIGAFLGALLDFVIIGFVIFWIVKLVVREPKK